MSRRLALRLGVVMLSTMVALVLAEWAYRRLSPGLTAPFYQTSERRRVDMTKPDGGLTEICVLNEHVPAGRMRNSFVPSATFYICYENATLDYFDDQGCVEYRINSWQTRERESLCGPKPEGQRRVVCLGDSFTFGWGVRVEDCWVRLVEQELRAREDGLRTVNCGVASGFFVDEYSQTLRERYHAFDPDVVVVTLCLNDLIPSFQVLSHRPGSIPWVLRQSKIMRDLFAGYAMRSQLATDPDVDVVRQLLGLDPAAYGLIGWIAASQIGHRELWAGGGPQTALGEIRDWCEARGVKLGVAIWPYLQGLGPGEHYPFETIHAEVEAFCASQSIPFHDVLPSLRGQPSESLWVHPSDLHANARAQALAAPGIAGFVTRLLDG